MTDSEGRFEDKFLRISIVLLPLFYLSLKNWTETWLVILSLISICGFVKSGASWRDLFPDKRTKIIFSSLILPFVCAFIAIVLRGDLRFDCLAYNLDIMNAPSRFIVAGVVFLWMNHRKVNFLRSLAVALPFSIILTAFFATVQQPGATDRYTTSLVDLDCFSHQICVLGILQMIISLLCPPESRLLRLLGILSLLVAARLAIGSGGRGGWVAVPPVLLLCALLYRGPKRRLILLGALSFLILGVELYRNRTFRERVVSIYSETNRWIAGTKTVTSAGHRMSMWLISFELIKSNPLSGYGSKVNLWKPVYELDPNRYLRPGFNYEDEEAARFTLCATGEHNEYLFEYLSNGILGFLSKVLLLLMPLSVFISKMRAAQRGCYVEGLTGVCFVIAFLIFGMTQGVFSLKLVCSFYGFIIAGLASEAAEGSPEDAGKRSFSSMHSRTSVCL
jgi:O-antigen ligase